MIKRLKGTLSVLLMLVLLMCSGCILSKGGQVDTQEPKILWTFETEGQVRLSQYDPRPAEIHRFWLAENAAVGERSLAIEYTIPAGSFALLTAELDEAEDWSDYKGLSMWICGSGNDITFGHRFLSGGYNKMAEYWIEIDWVGWKEIHMDFSKANVTGDFHWTEITKVEFFLSNSSGKYPEERTTLYYDHLVLLPEVEPGKVVIKQ